MGFPSARVRCMRAMYHCVELYMATALQTNPKVFISAFGLIRNCLDLASGLTGVGGLLRDNIILPYYKKMECPICFESVSEDTSTPCCNKPIHRKCLHMCLNRYNTCPLCREPMHIIEIHTEYRPSKCMQFFMFLAAFAGAGVFASITSVIVCKAYN